MRHCRKSAVGRGKDWIAVRLFQAIKKEKNNKRFVLSKIANRKSEIVNFPMSILVNPTPRFSSKASPAALATSRAAFH